jgi:thiol-disulfide isomerase/thioredoxin
VRTRLAALLVPLALAAAHAAPTDDLSRIRTDGSAAWRASIPLEADPGGAATTPLIAPAWFAKSPDVKIKLAPTGAFDLAAARGKVLLLDYWASWCAPCVKELPHLQQLHATHSADGFLALAVNVDEDAAVAAESARRLGLTMMIGINDPELKLTLGVKALPTLLLFDKQGRLRARWDGYSTGLEHEIADRLDKLMADDASGTTREMATVLAGQGRLQARWFRELPGLADGVVGLPAEGAAGARVVASTGEQLVSFDSAGEVVARARTSPSPGRLLDFGTAADGTRELVGYRTGATSVGVIALRSGTQRAISLPAPLLDIAAVGQGKGGERRLALATMQGAAFAGGSDEHAVLAAGTAGVRAVAVTPGHGVLSLREDGTIAPLGQGSAAWPRPATGAERLIAPAEDGVVAAPRTIVAAVSGRFLPGDGRQIAVATYAGHLVLLDEATGAIQFDSVWPAGMKDLAAADLDGDGRDELLVASARSITALGAVAR